MSLVIPQHPSTFSRMGHTSRNPDVDTAVVIVEATTRAVFPNGDKRSSIEVGWVTIVSGIMLRV
jgi:hypothetical protein